MNELLDYLMPHYKCGWNDTQYGTVDFPTNSDRWNNAEDWVKDMKQRAQELWNQEFYNPQPTLHYLTRLGGCIACCEQFLKDGKVDRL